MNYGSSNEFPGTYSGGGAGVDMIGFEKSVFCSGALINGFSLKSEKDKIMDKTKISK